MNTFETGYSSRTELKKQALWSYLVLSNDLSLSLNDKHLKGLSVAPRVANPRRAHFTPQGLEDFKEMVEHNRQNFDTCGAIVFWFPKDMLTPVALCELGSVLTGQKPIFIDVELGYKRAIDVEIQTHLERPEVSIADSLEQLARQVNDYYTSIAR